jgi:hypothetical protein
MNNPEMEPSPEAQNLKQLPKFRWLNMSRNTEFQWTLRPVHGISTNYRDTRASWCLAGGRGNPEIPTSRCGSEAEVPVHHNLSMFGYEL